MKAEKESRKWYAYLMTITATQYRRTGAIRQGSLSKVKLLVVKR